MKISVVAKLIKNVVADKYLFQRETAEPYTAKNGQPGDGRQVSGGCCVKRKAMEQYPKVVYESCSLLACTVIEHKDRFLKQEVTQYAGEKTSQICKSLFHLFKFLIIYVRSQQGLLPIRQSPT